LPTEDGTNDGVRPDILRPDEVFDLLGERWVLQILMALGSKPMRFTRLKRSIPGVSANVLTARLRQLETAQLVVRITSDAPSPHRMYGLGLIADSLRPALAELAVWKSQLAPGPSPQHGLNITDERNT